MTDVAPVVVVDPALTDLSERERAFAIAVAGGARASEAALEAGYADGMAPRLRRRPKIAAAIRALVAARDARAQVDHEALCRLLEAALLVRPTDLLVFDDDGVTPIGVRPRESLSPAEEIRLRKLTAKVHASAKGRRGGVRWIEVELIDPLQIVDRIARLRGYSPDSPSFSVLIQNAVATPGKSAGLELLHEAAADLLEGPELDEYLRAHLAGDTSTQVQLLRESAQRLRGVRDAITAEVVE